MNFTKSLLLGVILLPSVATASVVGNLTYDGTYITGDGKTYLGFDTGASWDYATTVSMTSAGGAYEDFSIATTADADFFIGSLFGDQNNSCAIVDGTATRTWCGNVAWTNGIFGNNYGSLYDYVWFMADESNSQEVGHIELFASHILQEEAWSSVADSDYFASPSLYSISWLLVKDSNPSVIPEPSVIALLGLGIFGLGLTRRKMKR